MKHKNILRIWCDMHYEAKIYEEIYEYCKSNIKSIDEIIFFTQSVHSVRSFEDIKKRLDFIGVLMLKFRSLGVKVGIDVLCTLGHHEEHTDALLEGYDFFKDASGKINRGRLCSSSPKTMEYIRQVYSYAASLNPDTIHIDDDLHYVVDCRCERCERIFARKYADNDNNHRLFTRERLCNIFRVIEKSVHSINENIAIGWMTCRYGEDGIDYTDYADAIKGDNGKVLWRPGGGVYNDESVLAFVKKAHSIGRQISALPEYVDEIYGEIENFPNYVLKKSPEFMTREVLTYIAAGCTGTAYNVLSLNTGALAEYEPWLSTFDITDTFASVLVEHLGKEKPIGIGKLLTDNVSIEDAASNDEICCIGLPLGYTKETSCCYILYKSIAEQLSVEQLTEVLKTGVMMDGETLCYLNSLGLGEYTGFSAERTDSEWICEKNLEHPFNINPDLVRDTRVSFGWCPKPYKILKNSDSAEYVTELIDYNGEHKGFASGIFENALGGRVYVSGYVAFGWFENYNRSESLKRIFRYISKDTLPAYVSSFHKISVFARKNNIVLSNLTAGKAQNVEIAIKTDSNSVTLCRKHKEEVNCCEIVANKQDGVYKIFTIENMEYAEVILLSLNA